MMGQELISKKTRCEFREHFVGYTLHEISMEFDAADIPCSHQYNPQLSGQRRSLVEQYYYSLDFTCWADVNKLLQVYENALNQLEQNIRSNTDTSYAKEYQAAFNGLRNWLRKDGFDYSDGRLRQQSHLQQLGGVTTAARDLDAPELHRQLRRMTDSVDSDPELAIGTAKELIETTCKAILSKRNVPIDSGWDLPRLVKEVRGVLKLLPTDIPDSARGAKTIKQLLSSLGTIAQGLGEIRNLYGTGHGRAGSKRAVSPRHARLAVGAAATLANFLFETHEERDQGV